MPRNNTEQESIYDNRRGLVPEPIERSVDDEPTKWDNKPDVYAPEPRHLQPVPVIVLNPVTQDDTQRITDYSAHKATVGGRNASLSGISIAGKRENRTRIVFKNESATGGASVRIGKSTVDDISGVLLGPRETLESFSTEAFYALNLEPVFATDISVYEEFTIVSN